jgi:hypothetical protein
LFDCDAIEVAWRENVVIIFLNGKKEWKMNRREKKRVDEWRDDYTWIWWGEGGERNTEIWVAQVDVIEQIGSMEVLEKYQRQSTKRDGANTSIEIKPLFRLRVCVFFLFRVCLDFLFFLIAPIIKN